MSERVDIFLSVWDAENPFDFMRALGIAWDEYEAQHMADQIKFIGCSNLPRELPPCLRVRMVKVDQK